MTIDWLANASHSPILLAAVRVEPRLVYVRNAPALLLLQLAHCKREGDLLDLVIDPRILQKRSPIGEALRCHVNEVMEVSRPLS